MNMEFLTHLLRNVTSFSYKLRLQKKKKKEVKLPHPLQRLLFSGKQKNGYNECWRPWKSLALFVLNRCLYHALIPF